MSVRWLDPTTWPWGIYVWLLFVFAGVGRSLWQWFERRRALGWPTTSATIESVDVREKDGGFLGRGKDAHPFLATIKYKYFAEGDTSWGAYKKEFEEEEDAAEFVRDLHGTNVVAHYRPGMPATSVLSEESLREVRERRPPPGSPAPPKKDPLPIWVRPLLWPFIALSLVGLVISLWVHINAVLGNQVLETYYFFLLHAGVFVVFLPGVMVSGRSGDWKKMLKGPSQWLLYPLYIFGAYAFINFVIFVAQVPEGKIEGAPSAIVLRGFSGHWMVFYYASFAMLYAAVTRGSVRRCLNGHPLGQGDRTCKTCGSPSQPAQS